MGSELPALREPFDPAPFLDALAQARKQPKPVLIDLFACAGGTAKGYQRAGFFVICVDIDPQPNNCGDLFIQADALELLAWLTGQPGVLAAIGVIHASPPCQARSDLRHRTGREYPELIEPTQRLVDELDKPYVIENVEGAFELRDPIVLCGTMFPGLRVLRHRLFESNVELVAPPHPRRHPLVFTHDKRKAHYGQLDQDTAFVQVTGGGNCTVANKADAMGIDWMTGAELNEAIPPAYTEWIGWQLRFELERRRSSATAAVVRPIQENAA